VALPSGRTALWAEMCGFLLGSGEIMGSECRFAAAVRARDVEDDGKIPVPLRVRSLVASQYQQVHSL